ncbi:MAG: ABC transporter ATP-binding protein/permease [Clostridiales bacterium]|jgi:ATP-binding cassette subfamily B protein|nr:ABC transporter ATP-binding protein/permease [Clostridiales bacterium]
MNFISGTYPYFRKYTLGWITAQLLGWISVICFTLLPQIPQLVVDRVLNPALGNPAAVDDKNVFSGFLARYSADDYGSMLLTLCSIMGVLILTRYLCHYVRWNLEHTIGVYGEKRLRTAVYAKMLDQNSMVMSRYTNGDLMSICNSDPNAIKDFYTHTLQFGIEQTFALAIAIYFLARINPYLLILPIVLSAVMGVAMVFYSRALRRCYNNIREASVNLNSCVQENINGVRIVRSYAAEDIEVKKFDVRNKAYKDNFIAQARVLARYGILFGAISQAIMLGSTVIGAVLAMNGQMTVGQFITFGTYVYAVGFPIRLMVDLAGAAQNTAVCAHRVLTFLNTSNIIADPPKPGEIPAKPDLSLRNVSIAIDEDGVLKNVSVEIPYGKKLGIMGKTGAGKTVLVKALCRLFETTVGETCVNGVNIKNYRVEDVRRLFGYVMQDVFLFSNTVDANIAFYDPDGDRERVKFCAAVADAHDFIERMPQGYETVIGERGLGLSGGQKQRVSIARALYKDAPVILLDDCTSALDLATERKVLRAIDEHFGDRTLVITSHRASSVIACDEILFLDGGEIAERGTHSELMAQKGRYHDVFISQEAAMREALV